MIARETRLGEFDLPATVLLCEIMESGYAGDISILKGFAATSKGGPMRQVVECFETLPDRQVQLGWGEGGTIDAVLSRESRRVAGFTKDRGRGLGCGQSTYS